MNKYMITPELSDYFNQLQLASTHVELLIVAINYALKIDGQPLVVSQKDLHEFVELSKFDL